MKQIYEYYTEEDQQVWDILYGRQFAELPDAACQDFLKGLTTVNFRAGEIPHFERANKILQEKTGWQLSVVPGIVPDDTFFGLMSERYFPATTWLRKMSELDYLEEPDMFHDVFAHVPLLVNKSFVDFLQRLSLKVLEYHEDKWAVELFSRVYWFTAEFGLIRENGALRIYGAGILSSKGETVYSLTDQVPKYPYNPEVIMRDPYRKDVFQDRYFVVESYEELFSSIPAIIDALHKYLPHRPKDFVA